MTLHIILTDFFNIEINYLDIYIFSNNDIYMVGAASEKAVSLKNLKC